MAKQGETVAIQFTGSTGTGLPVTLKDANGNIRTLSSTQERLIVDSLGLSMSTADPLWVFAGSSTVASTGVLLAYLPPLLNGTGESNLFYHFPSEGVSCPLGVLPTVLDPSSQNNGVVVTGTGRIVQDGAIANPPTRPSWKEALTGAGIPPGYGPNTTANNSTYPATGQRAMAPDGRPNDGSINPIASSTNQF